MTWKRAEVCRERDFTGDEGFWELIKFLNKECRYYKITTGWRDSISLYYAPRGYTKPRRSGRINMYPRSLEETNIIFVKRAFEIAKDEVFY
jgi:hypothetical protein